MKNAFLLSMGLCLASCAQVQQQQPVVQISQEEKENIKKEATQHLKTCLQMNVASLDDGKSDAATVAKAAASSCTPEYLAFEKSLMIGAPEYIQNEFHNRQALKRGDEVIPMVLKYRRLKK